jgi:hypothetical protein
VTLRLVPTDLRAVNAFIAARHRSRKPARGCKFVLAVSDASGAVVGVAVVGRPNAKANQDGRTLEVTRCCTDGTRNACSKLYGTARRVAGIMGYRLVITYSDPAEGGASLRAAGFQLAGVTEGREWSRPRRQRAPDAAVAPKWRWESVAAPDGAP